MHALKAQKKLPCSQHVWLLAPIWMASFYLFTYRLLCLSVLIVFVLKQ